LIQYYKPLGMKVVAIEQNIQEAHDLEALKASMPDDFDIISGSYTESDILSRHGYTCAMAAFSLWPGADYKGDGGYKGIPTAINNLVCPGGYIHVITEVDTWFDFIVNGLANTVDIEFKSPPTLWPSCVRYPLSSGCSEYSSVGIPVGFDSYHIGSENYALIGKKR